MWMEKVRLATVDDDKILILTYRTQTKEGKDDSLEEGRGLTHQVNTTRPTKVRISLQKT